MMRLSGSVKLRIADGATGCLIGPKLAKPDGNKIAGTVAQGCLGTGSAQDDHIAGVAIGDDTVLGVVLDEIQARAAFDLEPGIGDRNVGVEAAAVIEQTIDAGVCGTCQDSQRAGRRRRIDEFQRGMNRFPATTPWRRCRSHTVAGVAMASIVTENKVVRALDGHHSGIIVRLQQLRELVYAAHSPDTVDTYGCRPARDQKVELVAQDPGIVECYRQATCARQCKTGAGDVIALFDRWRLMISSLCVELAEPVFEERSTCARCAQSCRY
jgi:hypothetical protein